MQGLLKALLALHDEIRVMCWQQKWIAEDSSDSPDCVSKNCLTGSAHLRKTTTHFATLGAWVQELLI